MQPLLGKSLAELEALCGRTGMPAYAARQIAQWLYRKRADSINAMTNLFIPHRQALLQTCCTGRSAVCTEKVSYDGTIKYLFNTLQGSPIESVYIPDGSRATLCVSSQAGCRMGCRFCMTAKMGFVENISAADILNQILSIPHSADLTNIVLMGMGEPLDNWGEVRRAFDVIMAKWGMAWSPHRITLSTIGIGSALTDFLAHCSVNLAVSIHSPFAAERQALVPMQKTHPIEETIRIIRRHNWTGQRRVSFEYILFDGINDSIRHAKALAKLLRGLECRVNLIRFHPIPQSDLSPSADAAVAAFQQCLRQSGIVATLRASRGQDIMAACGMLAVQRKKINEDI